MRNYTYDLFIISGMKNLLKKVGIDKYINIKYSDMNKAIDNNKLDQIKHYAH